MGFVGSLGKIISNTVKNVGNIIKDPASLATIALMAWMNPVGTLGYLASAAVYTGVMAFTSALSPTPDMPNLDTNAFVGEAQARTQTIKQPAQPRRVVYGKVRIGGVITFIATEGKKNKFLYMLVTYTGHEINRFVTHRIDDQNVTVKDNVVTAPSRFKDGKTQLVRIYEKTGTDGQSALSSFVNTFSSFTKDHRQRGCALVGYRFQFNDKAYPNGLPQVSAVIEGAKIKDVDDLSANRAYNNNPANVIYDYMTNSDYGMGLTDAEMDLASFQTAKAICDENVTLSNGNTEKRYRVNGAFQVNQSHKAIITQLLTSCGGQLTYQNGKFNLTVAAPRTPVLTITEDDLISAIDIKTAQSIADQYNTVKGTFVSPSGGRYVPTDFKKITSSTFLTEDNNVERSLDIAFNYETSHSRAQRLAKIILFRSRQAITISTTMTLKGFNLKAGDWVYVTLPRYGFNQKAFEVASWTLSAISSETLGVEILLRETNSAVYDWNAEEDDFQEDNTQLPDPFSILPPTMVLGQSLASNNQKATTNLDVTVTAQDLYSSTFEVFVQQISPTLEAEISLGRGATNLFQYPDVATGSVYQVRARSFSNVGTISNFVTDTITIAGKSALSLPTDVQDFRLNYIGTQALLTWTPTPDPDLSHYVIRHQNVTSGADFSQGIVLASKVARPANQVIVPALEGTYFCVAVDKYGNTSGTPATAVGVIDENPVTSGFVQLQAITEHSAFTGAKNNVLLDIDTTTGLILDTAINFDDKSGNFDDATGLFDGGGGNVAPSGTYDFANTFDLGSKQRFRVLFTPIQYSRLQYGTATSASSSAVDVQLQIATTDDDPAASPTYTAFSNVVSGDYSARSAKFRLLLTSSSVDDTPFVTQAGVEITAEIRTISEGNISSGTSASGKAVTYPQAFNTFTGLGISAENLLTGEFYQITNKTTTGFTIIFKDSANTVINRTFDYVASGAGRVI